MSSSPGGLPTPEGPGSPIVSSFSLRMPKRSRTITLAIAVSLATAVFVIALASPARSAASTPVPTFVTCDPFPGIPATCGTVDVPLDRAQPAAGTIPIYFELDRHSDSSRPSLVAIVPSIGGPGVSNTFFRGLWLSVFGPLLDRRDLLVIDDRGTGRSAAVDCPALQHFVGEPASAVRACGAQLGAASSRYGSGDVADDIDAVRAALGIDKIDYYGGSFGARTRLGRARYPCGRSPRTTPPAQARACVPPSSGNGRPPDRSPPSSPRSLLATPMLSTTPSRSRRLPPATGSRRPRCEPASAHPAIPTAARTSRPRRPRDQAQCVLRTGAGLPPAVGR
jgi:hypothetical protein